MIREVTPKDSATVVALAVDSGLFEADEAAFVETMMVEFFARGADQGHACALAVAPAPDGSNEPGPRGVVYYQPALATDRAWYVTMIAVRRDQQGTGCGTALMRHVERTLREQGQRLVLVETSGTPEFAATRRFYAGLGYDEEARVRDYYADGVDMVLFRQDLTA